MTNPTGIYFYPSARKGTAVVLSVPGMRKLADALENVSPDDAKFLRAEADRRQQAARDRLLLDPRGKAR